MVKKKHKGLRKIHIGAAVLLGVYFIIGNTILASYSFRENIWDALFVPFLYGALACVVFLYIFSHESFFSFAKDIEKKEMKSEKRLVKRIGHLGKKITAFVATIVGGPILGALTIRLLLNTMRHKYLFLVLSNVPSTIFTVGFLRGAFSFFS